jgi:glycosyltransferase involved in cell wall biosynthesis
VCFDCSKYPYDFYLDKIPDNVKVFNLIDNYRIKTLAESFKRYPKLFWLGTEIFYLNELVKLISELRPRVINGWLDSPSIICGLAGIIHSVPKIVLSSRNMNPSRFLTFRSFMKPAYQKFGSFENFLFTNNSKAGADDYTNWLKFSSGKIKVIPNGYFLDDFIDLSDSTKINILANRFVVGGVARFSYEKDLELWVEVAHKLSEINKNVRFVLYGTGPLKASIIKRVETLGLRDIFFLQPPTSEIYRKLSEMKVMLLTSKVEGLPNVLIEAQLLGIPAVSTRAGGSGETYVHDSTGYEITSRDSSEIAKKINDLLRDSSLYQKFSKSAMEQARKNFDIELIGRKYLELYNAI